MLDDQRSKALVRILSDATGISSDRFTDETALFHDLGIGGLDGVDILEAIESEFKIDLGDVAWWRYFGEEAPYNPLYHLICFIRGRRLDHDIVRLEVSDLKRTIEAGVWQAPEES